MSPQVFAKSYKVLIVPDNIVTETASVDSYVYEECAEFFADGVISLINGTDLIESQPVSVTRDMLKKDASAMMSAKNLTNRFKNSYNVDYAAVKKLGQKAGTKYVMLITSSVDAQNYILRRTLWDFLNIPGATVVDPAYKISTYAILIDTSNNSKVWDDTYYKTISVCENRIITRGPSPQTEQLEKIRDYSRYLCPQIAQHIQASILPADAKESDMIEYGLKDIDNVFTKKYRHLGRETSKLYNEKKTNFRDWKANRQIRKAEKQIEKAKREAAKQEKLQQETKLEVKATPVSEDTEIRFFKKQTEPEPVKYYPDINTKPVTTTTEIPANYVKPVTETTNTVIRTKDTESEGINLNIRRRKHNLYGDYYTDQPALRGYTK